MIGHFPSMEGLTWQEWRANTCPMESADNLANPARSNRLTAECVLLSVSNLLGDRSAHHAD
jgi:hypothetical protein